MNPPDAKVKLRGVEVGRVGDITERDGNAILTLDIADSEMSKIPPGNVIADIKSNTIFGAKAVNFVVPDDDPPQGKLAAGDEISADRVVVELNTVFQQLVSVLAELQPEKLNATLGAVDTALSGQGEEVGVALEQLTTLLGKTNPHLPALNRLFREGATVTNVYADSMPDLLRTVDNFTVVGGNTLVDNTSNLDALLINATGMANTIDGVIAPTKETLIGALSDLNPIAALLGYNAPGIKCFLTAGAWPRRSPPPRSWVGATACSCSTPVCCRARTPPTSIPTTCPRSRSRHRPPVRAASPTRAPPNTPRSSWATTHLSPTNPGPSRR